MAIGRDQKARWRVARLARIAETRLDTLDDRMFQISVGHEKQPVTSSSDGGDTVEVEMQDLWTILLTEQSPPTGNQYVISFGRETRDEMVRVLTGGIVLAGGDLPRIP